MAIFRIEKTNNYTVMANYHLQEKEMSLKAKGLLSLMLSLPDNWDYSINGLVSICKENKNTIKSTLEELKEFGYLVVNKLMPNQTKSGRIEYEYIIYEEPQNFEKQHTKKQYVVSQYIEKQRVENYTQLNTNILNTNKNKKLNNKYRDSACIDNKNIRSKNDKYFGHMEQAKKPNDDTLDVF